VTSRLLEASDRNYWSPDPETLAALLSAQEDLEDRIEGLRPEPEPAAAAPAKAFAPA